MGRGARRPPVVPLRRVGGAGGRASRRPGTGVFAADRPAEQPPAADLGTEPRVDLLLLEGCAFACPWTGTAIRAGGDYHLDHLVPLAIYPVNDLWNLVPSDPVFSGHGKRDRLPSDERLVAARPRLAGAYGNYLDEKDLGPALAQDALARFSGFTPERVGRPDDLAGAVAASLAQVADGRNTACFSGGSVATIHHNKLVRDRIPEIRHPVRASTVGRCQCEIREFIGSDPCHGFILGGNGLALGVDIDELDHERRPRTPTAVQTPPYRGDGRAFRYLLPRRWNGQVGRSAQGHS